MSTVTTADARGELFGVHIPELQLPIEEYRSGFEAAGLCKDERYLELGSGHGHGVVLAAQLGARATGVEYLADAIERTQLAARRAGVEDRVTLVRGDLQSTDMSRFDVVHMHLGPAFHDVLAAQLEQSLDPEARVVAAGWQVPGWLPDPAALEAWDGGYVYRPADPAMHASWRERGDGWIEALVHADLHELEARFHVASEAAHVACATSHSTAGRGTCVLVALPDDLEGTLEVWARDRAGRLARRGPAT